MSAPGRVGSAAFGLGFAGLVPQLAAVVLTLGGEHVAAFGRLIATGYGVLILSFLGGMWWGIAMRREQRQGRLVALAVLPSLVAAAILAWAGLSADEGAPGPLLALGVAIMLTLLVDRHLVSTGEAPQGWTALRAPLSLGLGLLTFATGLLGG